MVVFKRELKAGMKGDDVVDLQLLLAGFSGSVWDGVFGPVTKKQVVSFQLNYMKLSKANGIVDSITLEAIKDFVDAYQFDFDSLKCKCQECKGFGNGKYGGEFIVNKPRIEAYHMKEYNGIHKAILYTYMAVLFFGKQSCLEEPSVLSGYRCWFDNKKNNKTSTNHMGKAVDISSCDLQFDTFRDMIAKNSNCQIGWGVPNRKSLDPSDLNSNRIHLDVRCFDKKYLVDKFFAKKFDEVFIQLNKEPIEVDIPVNDKPFKAKEYNPSDSGMKIINDTNRVSIKLFVMTIRKGLKNLFVR